MQFKKTFLAVMMMAAATVHADYRTEIGLMLSGSSVETEYDDIYSDFDTDTSTVGLAGAFYFESVRTDKGPLGEAAFLAKASGLAVGFLKEEVEYDYKSGGKLELDSARKSIFGHFVLPSPNLIFEFSYATGEKEEVDTDQYAFGIGGYINDRATLLLEYSREKTDDYRYEDESIKRLTVTYRQLIELSGQQSLAIEPFIAGVDYHGEDGAEVGVDGAWYFNDFLALTASLSGFAAEADEGDASRARTAIGIEYFINQTFRIGGELYSEATEFDADDPAYVDYEMKGGGIEATASVRF